MKMTEPLSPGDRCQLEGLAIEEQAEVFRCAHSLSHITGPVRRPILPLVRPSNWHTKLALAAFVEALPIVEYLTVQRDPILPFACCVIIDALCLYLASVLFVCCLCLDIPFSERPVFDHAKGVIF